MFGEYLDIIHALGGVLHTVVVNVPDPPRPGPIKSFAERVEAYDDWLNDAGSDHRLEIVQVRALGSKPPGALSLRALSDLDRPLIRPTRVPGASQVRYLPDGASST